MTIKLKQERYWVVMIHICPIQSAPRQLPISVMEFKLLFIMCDLDFTSTHQFPLLSSSSNDNLPLMKFPKSLGSSDL